LNPKPKTQNPLVSIIIPTYNRAHLIGETLDSVLAQTYENWECIIVDDGSSDNTDEVVGTYVQKDPRFQYHKRPDTHKPGGNGARNYGFEVSKGEYVNWFDDDDVMLEGFLDMAIEKFKSTQVDFVLFDYKVFNQESGDFFVIQKNETNNLIEDYVTFKINFGTWAIVWNRKLIFSFQFNEELVKAQDLDFNFRVLTSTEYNFAAINRFGLLVRGHADSIVQDYKKNKLKSITSELHVRRQVFIYMLEHSNDINVKTKCFELYTDPLLKLIKLKKHYLLLRETIILSFINTRLFFENFFWFYKTITFLIMYFIFDKGEYRFKYQFLKYSYS
jgi:glycosyltransferase involved in cell wall biosynthesis